MRHELNSLSKDVEVYLEKDKSNYIGVSKSKNGQFIFITSQATLSSEQLYIDANKPSSAFISFQPRIKNVLYDVVALNDRFLIRTNANALNFKVMECPLNNTNYNQWKDIVPHRADVLVQSIEAFKDFVVITERKNGLIQLNIKQNNAATEHYIQFEEPAYTASLGSNPEFNSNTIRYSYTSLTTPNSVYDYEVSTKNKTLKKQQEVVGDIIQKIILQNVFMQLLKMELKFLSHWFTKKDLKKMGMHHYFFMHTDRMVIVQMFILVALHSAYLTEDLFML